MKSWNKNRGWILNVVGGPADGAEWRTWMLTGDPDAEIKACPSRRQVTIILDSRFPDSWFIDTRGAYYLTPTLKKDGSPRIVRAGGVEIPAVHYEWVQELPHE